MGWINWRGKKAKRLMDKQVQQATYEAGTAILQEAKQQVPLDEGTLMNSGEVYKDHNSVASAISFGYGSGTGKPKLPYAVKWHEQEANFQHGRKNQYLVDPLKQIGPRAFKKSLQQQIKDAF